jgi:hypothetical protein
MAKSDTSLMAVNVCRTSSADVGNLHVLASVALALAKSSL